MQIKKLKNLIFSKHFIKIISIIFGYCFWALSTSQQNVSIYAEVPLSFYNIPVNLTIDAPEKIIVKLEGTRNHLSMLKKKKLAIHYNAQSFTTGKKNLSISKDNLFLPNTIKLVDYKPSDLVISINK